ncbi:Collagen alpha-1(XXI) chain [Merluccius polli]|uniref:Collagen alpha-1(XXI) chain n=1 Tax=Merluccius polli TaxID=89951 RepID=A0AA47NRF9_MERPO|nr:Collagen alpha-1(XXI) chain [Merluccius polli]
MGYKTRSMHSLFRCLCFMLLHLLSTAQDEDLRSCRTAACDLVFILDGSWSVEDVNFDIVKRWLVNITTSFNIGQKFVQVGVVQYSDDPVLQIPLGKHLSNKDVIAAMESIEYMGGNTRTGTAIQFATDKLFGLSERGPGGIARIAVVLTDGKSQDTVLKAAEAARKKGIIIFAIGVGSETEVLELQDIANKPSSTYVFSVVDYKAIDKIREVIRQKLCEETVCPNRIAIDSREEKGFDILLHLNLAKKARKTQGSFYGTRAYEITSRVDLSDSTRSLFPDGLPPSYVFVATLKYKGSVTLEQWDLWRVQTLDEKPQMAVTLNGADYTVAFTTTSDAASGIQTVTFSPKTARVLFDEKWHQFRLLVTEEDVTLYVDDLEVETLPLETPIGIFINGKTQVGKYVSKETTVPFEIQKLRIYCDPEQNNRETACEIPGICSNSPDYSEFTPEPCACPPGPAGLPGMKGEQGGSGEPGKTGPAGADGKPALEGILGYQVNQEKRAHGGRMGSRESKGQLVIRAQWDSREDQGCQDKMAKWGLRVSLDQLGHRDIQESRECTEEMESMEFRGELDRRERPVPMVCPVWTDERDTLVRVVYQVNKVQLDYLEPREEKVREDRRDAQGSVKGQLEKQDREAKEILTQILKALLHCTLHSLAELPTLLLSHQQTSCSRCYTRPGSPGPPGPNGANGIRGFPGIPGSSGSPGRRGISGHPGIQGIKGDPGLKGDIGNPGRTEVGDQGPQGPPGPMGPHGYSKQGSPGKPGAPGQSGAEGKRGQPGVPGQNGVCHPALCYGSMSRRDSFSKGPNY